MDNAEYKINQKCIFCYISGGQFVIKLKTIDLQRCLFFYFGFALILLIRYLLIVYRAFFKNFIPDHYILLFDIAFLLTLLLYILYLFLDIFFL